MFDLNAIVSAAIATAVDARITELMQQHANIVGALAERIEKLENNPAIGVDTTLEARVVALEQRPATAVAGVITPEMIVESMNKAEWLWEKVNAYIETGIEDRIERAIEDHCGTYDHDDYDSHISDDDIHIEGDLEDAVTDAVRNLTFEVTVS